MRKQIGSAHKAEEEAKKLKAAANGQKQKEESLSKEQLARPKGSAEVEERRTCGRPMSERCPEPAAPPKKHARARFGAGRWLEAHAGIGLAWKVGRGGSEGCAGGR